MIKFYFFSFILGGFGAIIIRYLGENIGLMDTPNHRSSHTAPTPKGGGVGILAAFLMISLITHKSPLFFLPICLISFLCLYGDRVELPPKVRLIAQLLAALVITLSLSNENFPLQSSFVLLPLWLVFIVGTANFFNFMDGINGIAGITGSIAFGLMAYFTQLENLDASFVPLALSLTFACIGFLPFNIPKAKVFMGDVASILLGFVFAILVFINSHTFLNFICYASLLFPFYIDELSTMAVRLKNREKLTQAHRSHLYQLLTNEKKIAHWKISLGYGLLQFFIGISVFMLKPYGIPAVLGLLLLATIIFLQASFRIRTQLSPK